MRDSLKKKQTNLVSLVGETDLANGLSKPTSLQQRLFAITEGNKWVGGCVSGQVINLRSPFYGPHRYFTVRGSGRSSQSPLANKV